jgi:hypothetical protein
MATLTAPLKAKDVTAVLIANLASGAHLYASDRSLKGGLKDATPRPIPDEGLELGGITANTEVVIDDGKSQRNYSLEVGNAPTIAIWLANDPNQGGVEVDVRTPGAERSIDGRKARPLRSGKNYLSLDPGTHKIRFSKEGYEPIERSVELTKGETVKFGVIELKPLVLVSSLAIEGATRDADVLIDGNSKGTVSGDGSFRLNDVPPGDHVITLRKADFEDKQIPRTFVAGQAIRIAGAEGQLVSLFGILNFRVAPPNATITYRKPDETLAHAAENGKELRVKTGQYVITATAAGRTTRQDNVTVDPAVSRLIEWTLPLSTTINDRKAPPPPSPPVSHFDDPSAWTQDDGWWIHRGSDIGWMRHNQGTYVMEFQKQKSGVLKRTRHVDWVIDQSSTHRIEYSFDFGGLERKAMVNGKTEKNNVRLPAGASAGDSYTIQIEIAPEQVVIRDSKGKELDRYERPNRTEAVGKFGFKGDVALAIRKADER